MTTSAKLIGLTGGIASGKSTVAQMLGELGYSIIDADQISRQLSQPGGPAYQAIIRRFGTADRASLRTAIISDPKARADLEGILHPLIRDESLKLASELSKKSSKPIIYEAALLIEAGRTKDVHAVIVVEAPLETRIERLIARDQMNRSQALALLQTQASDDTRRKHATYLIVNNGSLEDLKSQVLELSTKLV